MRYKAAAYVESLAGTVEGSSFGIVGPIGTGEWGMTDVNNQKRKVNMKHPKKESTSKRNVSTPKRKVNKGKTPLKIAVIRHPSPQNKNNFRNNSSTELYFESNI